MQVKRLSHRLSVSSQVSPEDMPAIRRMGFGTLICNRPDGEAEGQPTGATLAQAAEAQGLNLVHIPVVSGETGDDAVARFGEVVKAADQPVLAFCRTGTRSAMLWALANPDGLSVDARLKAAAAAEYDLSSLRPRLDAANNS